MGFCGVTFNMKLLGYLFVFFCAVLVCSGQSDPTTIVLDLNEAKAANVGVDLNTSTPAGNETNLAPETTSTAAATTSTAAAATTSTAAAATTSTAAATTTEVPITTPVGNETTPAPETTTEGPTTTPAPETTTEGPTTTPAPTPAAEQDVTYTLSNSTAVCLILQTRLTISLDYNATSGNATTGQLALTNSTLVNHVLSSNCSMQNELDLVLSIEGNVKNMIVFRFVKNEKKVSVNLLQFNSSDISTLFSNAEPVPVSLENSDTLFETTDTMSYSCKSQTKVKLGSATLTFSDMQVEAFRGKNDTNFSAAKECDLDDNVSDIVPIAVGCALAGLVVIVLIAYLVGRRQKRQRGYESV